MHFHFSHASETLLKLEMQHFLGSEDQNLPLNFTQRAVRRSCSRTSASTQARSPHACQSGSWISQNVSSSRACFRACVGVTHAAYVPMSEPHPCSIEAFLALATVIFLPHLQTYLPLSFPIIKVLPYKATLLSQNSAQIRIEASLPPLSETQSHDSYRD